MPISFNGPSLKSAIYLVVASLLLASCGSDSDKPGGGGGKKRGPDGPSAVIASIAASHEFVDSIEAVGTANARESVILSANVTERVKTLNFADGQYVLKGQVLAELNQAEENASLSEAKARLRESQLQLDRITQLIKDGYATRARLDQQIADRDGARAMVDNVRAKLDDRVIRAPFSGIIGLRRVSPGLIVNAGTPIAEISDISIIKLDFTIPETYLSAVHIGQAIQARAAAYSNKLFIGRIDGIDPQIDPITRSASIRALIPNRDNLLKPGMLLSVDVVKSSRKALAVPELGIIGERDQKFVYVIDKASNKVTKSRVLIGERDPGFVEITSGLEPGTLIVAEGVSKLRDGGEVKVLKTQGSNPEASSTPATPSSLRPRS